MNHLNIGIICYPTYGGSGVIATELGKALAKKGHKVHFITYQEPVRLDGFHENIFYHEVSSLDYPLFQYTPYESALASKIVDVVKFEKLDLLHVHYAIPHASSALMAKQILSEQKIFIPFVTTLHGTDITLVGRDPSYLPVVAYSINHSDGITCVSNFLKEDTQRHFNIRKHIEVIPNFIDFSRFRKTNKEHFKKAIAPEGEKIIMHTSNFRKVKRVEDVLLMFNLLIQKIPSKLLLVGDGPQRTSAEMLCRQLNICEHVRFLGKQDAIEDLLAIADLFVLPSETESFGLAALEAMACEVPVISSDAGGLPEIQIQGVTGFMSKVGDVEDMARNAVYILSDEATHHTFKQNAYQQARRFDIEYILPLYENYYSLVFKSAFPEYSI
ncbi:MAG: N-acetyl-alpha-D-glucosaminyl L-malate synthase BshA [Chitinophagales bacterium]|nr:N-acetyl-alpha-D-glucosaminyl L-malate synthase BshA [Chitinophagales bacterium]MDW8272937.1 N-acetyl-alpha-D-glucosaminyl L-malate synthase BshA [Chitinophagales bacterium]